MPTRFSVTWDYRCPFARNAHEHVLAGLAAGADWDVTFVPFSLGQVHVPDGEAPIWDRPDDDSGLWALRAGTIVRDRFPEEFLAVHRSLFAVRHDDGLKLNDQDAVVTALAKHLGAARAAEVADAVSTPEALAAVRDGHESAAGTPGVWGVPTFWVDGDVERAVFVRLMDRNPGESDDDRKRGRIAVDRVLHLLTGWPELNEFKLTRIPR